MLQKAPPCPSSATGGADVVPKAKKLKDGEDRERCYCGCSSQNCKELEPGRMLAP